MPINEHKMLKYATFWVIIGSSVSTLLKTIILINYAYSPEIRWLSDFPKGTMIFFLPLLTFSFITWLYFFITFHKTLKTKLLE